MLTFAITDKERDALVARANEEITRSTPQNRDEKKRIARIKNLLADLDKIHYAWVSEDKYKVQLIMLKLNNMFGLFKIQNLNFYAQDFKFMEPCIEQILMNTNELGRITYRTSYGVSIYEMVDTVKALVDSLKRFTSIRNLYVFEDVDPDILNLLLPLPCRKLTIHEIGDMQMLRELVSLESSFEVLNVLYEGSHKSMPWRHSLTDPKEREEAEAFAEALRANKTLKVRLPLV